MNFKFISRNIDKNYLHLIQVGGNVWDARSQNELTRTKQCCYHGVHSIQEPNVI